MSTSNTFSGVVHGKTTELDNDAGLPDGQPVSVVIHPTAPINGGLERAFGSWADDPEGVDKFVEETYRLRKLDRRNVAE